MASLAYLAIFPVPENKRCQSPGCQMRAMHEVWGVRLCEIHAPHPLAFAFSSVERGTSLRSREPGSVCEGQMYRIGALCIHKAVWTRRGHAFCSLHAGLCHYKYYGEIPCFKVAVRFLSDDFGYCLDHAIKRENENRCSVITRSHVQCKRATQNLPYVPFDNQPSYDCGGHWATRLPLREKEEEKKD